MSPVIGGGSHLRGTRLHMNSPGYAIYCIYTTIAVVADRPLDVAGRSEYLNCQSLTCVDTKPYLVYSWLEQNRRHILSGCIVAFDRRHITLAWSG
jgi:hypothetical protein